MKNIGNFALILLSSVMLCMACRENKSNDNNTISQSEPPVLNAEYRKPTTFSIDANFINFGNVKRGDTVEVSFILRNTGPESLFIEDAMVDCSCMKPSYPQEIKTGQTDTLFVKFLTGNYMGDVRKHVVLKANTEGRFSKLAFSGYVEEKK